MPTPAKIKTSSPKKSNATTAQLQADKAEGIVEVFNRQRLHKIERSSLISLAQAVLKKINRGECSATITFIRDREMQRLNFDYRGIDKPTDVLSFAYQEDLSDNDPNHNPAELGDCVISVETAVRYAQEQNISLATEINWLVIHGILHLAGYDHETDNGEMRRLEKRLRRELLS
jgi:probable rRNA maturation factor